MGLPNYWLDSANGCWLEHADNSRLNQWEGCARNRDHTFYDRHQRPLRIKARNRINADICWYDPTSAIVTHEVVALFKEHKITGYEIHPVEFYLKDKVDTTINRVELEVTGWGGVVPKSAGMRLLTRCTHCENRTYSMFTNAAAINSAVPEDAPDMFIIWPFSKVVFVSSRLADLLEIYGITGFKLRKSFDIKWSSIMPSLPPKFNKVCPGTIRGQIPRPQLDSAFQCIHASDIELTDAETVIT